MFINKDDLKNQIIDALRNPEFIKEATFKANGVIFGKSIDDEKKKMIDIGININDGVIFHINKKRWDTTMKALKNR